MIAVLKIPNIPDQMKRISGLEFAHAVIHGILIFVHIKFF